MAVMEDHEVSMLTFGPSRKTRRNGRGHCNQMVGESKERQPLVWQGSCTLDLDHVAEANVERKLHVILT